MPYAVATTLPVLDYLADREELSDEALRRLIATYEHDLALNADHLWKVGPLEPGSFCFQCEYPIPDIDTQHLFRLVVSMESAAGGVVRVVFADHEVLGRRAPPA